MTRLFPRPVSGLRAYPILLIVNATLTEVIAALTGINAMPTVVISALTIVEGLTSIVKASSLIVFESKTTIFAIPSLCLSRGFNRQCDEIHRLRGAVRCRRFECKCLCDRCKCRRRAGDRQCNHQPFLLSAASFLSTFSRLFTICATLAT